MTEHAPWRYFRFGLIVTGQGEEKFLPRLFRSLQTGGNCQFEVIRRIGQRSAITSPKKQLVMVGTGKVIPDKDQEDIGLASRKWLNEGGSFVILIDDLEHDRAPQKIEIFRRYRKAFDTMLKGQRHLASVHFLVNMLEAYYFANATAINTVLGTTFHDHPGDVEEIRHPKNELKKRFPGFDEIEHGERILEQLDVEHVLNHPERCGALRVLFAWCTQSMSMAVSDKYQLTTGVYDIVTGRQLGHAT